MEDRPRQCVTTWDDIVLGNRSKSVLAPEDQRQRARCDDWWRETTRMIDAAYARFWRKRGMVPPPVSNDQVETVYRPTGARAIAEDV